MALTLESFNNALEEYFREVLHPRCAEISRKHPLLWNNDSIRFKLKSKYPSSRMNDKEYSEHLYQVMSRPSFISKIPKDDTWKAGTIVVPFKGNS